MQISYLINQYPKVSHSFIRREILALERQGFNVQRIAQRGWADALVDPQDMSEREKTQYIVQQGFFALLFSTLQTLFTMPTHFLHVLYLAFKMASKSQVSLLHHLIYFAEACQLKTWLKAHGSQHLHAHFGTNSTEIAMFASLLSGVPYSFTVHGPEEFDKPQALGLNQKIKHAKFVVAISSFGRSQLYRWASFNDWPKIKIVHCGLEPAFYDIQAVPLPTAPVMVCVGRICEQKGQLLLIEAAKKLHETGLGFSLVLAGDGEMRTEAEALIKAYQLQEKISITGWISSDEVRAHLLAAQMLVLPSFAEGLPVVIMEAMSLRRPVISTYIAGIPELIVHGQHGWLCSAGDVDALASTMREALNTPASILEVMGDAAHQRVIARHNIDTEAAKLAAHFRV